MSKLSKLSENIFEEYLVDSNFEYEKIHEIETGSDFDFFVFTDDAKVYCDVKIITKATDELSSREPAKKRIRDDIVKLRRKFGELKPKYPCILVSMNFADQSISGFTVVDAMYGNRGITIEKTSSEKTSKQEWLLKEPIHYTYKGNAEMREGHNTAISGILGFNARDGNKRYLFHNHDLPPYNRTIS